MSDAKKVLNSYYAGFANATYRAAVPFVVGMFLFALLVAFNPLGLFGLPYIDQPYSEYSAEYEVYFTYSPVAVLDPGFYVAIIVYGLISGLVGMVLGIWLLDARKATHQLMRNLAAQKILGLDEEKKE